jgi:tetratricopeptide (TPR) repeat protein
MSFRGSLQSLGLFDVFQNVHQNRKTGTLVVRDERSERFVHFADGLVHLVSYGRGRGLPLRDHLVKRAYLSQEGLEKALRARGRGRAPLRKTLAKIGMLEEDEFVAAATERVEEFLYELLGTEEATFEYEEGEPPSGIFDLELKSLGLGIDPAPVIMEAARRDDEWGRIRKVVQSERDLFVRLGEDPPDADPDVLLVWNSLDGRSELKELARGLPLGDFEVQSIVAALVEEGMARAVHPADVSTLAREALEDGELDRAQTLLEHAVEIERGDRDLRRLLAETLEAQNALKASAAAWAVIGYQASMDGQDSEALDAYHRAIALDPVDIGLRERSYEILSRTGTTTEVLEAAVELSQGFLDLGLSDRAIEALEQATHRPDLAKRPGLLGRLARIEKDSGQAERGFDRLLGEAVLAEESGERELAEEFYLEGQRVFPERVELRQRLNDLRSHKRERQQRMRRRRLVLAVGVLFSGLVSLLLIEELRFSFEMRPVLRSSASAALEVRSTDAIRAAWSVHDSHPLAPTRSSVVELVHGLVDAEVLRLERERASGRLLSALHGYERLQMEIAGRLEVEGLRAKWRFVQQQKRVRDALEPWFLGREDARRDAGTLVFEKEDSDQVLALYGRLSSEGRALVRTRLVELHVPRVLPMLVERFLEGEDQKLTVMDETLSCEVAISGLVQLVNRNAAKDVRARAEAFDLVLDEYFDDRGRKEAARRLIGCFVQIEGPLPTKREEFEALLR